MDKIVEANKDNLAQGNGCCATHDYLDSNMVMQEAFKAVFKSEPMIDSAFHKNLWNQAWEIAIWQQFHPVPLFDYRPYDVISGLYELGLDAGSFLGHEIRRFWIDIETKWYLEEWEDGQFYAIAMRDDIIGPRDEVEHFIDKYYV